MGVLINYPKFQAFDDSGVPLAGALVFFYIPGSSTKKNTYTTAALAVANSNPLVLDSSGEGVVYGAGSYKIVLSPSTDTDPPTAAIWTMDNVEFGLGSASNALFVDPSETDQGAAGNGGSLYDILTALGTSEKATIYLTHNGVANTTSYTVSTTFDASAYDNINFVIENGALLDIDTSITLTLYSPNKIVAAKDQQIFDGAGSIVFSDTSVAYDNLLGWYGVSLDNKSYFAGYNAGTSTPAADLNNIGIGWNALTVVEAGGTKNTAIGIGALAANTTGTDSIAIGYSSLSKSLTGLENVAIGSPAMLEMLSGYQNVAIGGSASLQNSTDGIRNIAIGTNTLTASTSDDDNVAIGYSSQRYQNGGSSNISVGSNSLGGLATGGTSGNQNVAIGVSSMTDATTAYANTCVGMGAAAWNATGLNTVAIGYSAAQYLSDGTTKLTNPNNGVYVGANAMGSHAGNQQYETVIGSGAQGRGSRTGSFGSLLYTDWSIIYGKLLTLQANPVVQNTAVTLTAAQLFNGIIQSTPGAPINLTVPTSATLQAGGPPAGIKANDAREWSLINLSAHVITIVANTAHTLVGTVTVAANTSGRFLTREVGGSFTTYRLN